MLKAGILGGGQLGRMLLQAAANYPVETFVLEDDAECPAAHLCHHFTKGNITSFEDVYNFGKSLDVLTIEIESVNAEALEKLEEEGVRIIPSPAALKIIKNKIKQKEFYRENEIPTAEFAITQNINQVYNYPALFPAVHKIAQGGYDGRGVIAINDKEEIVKGFDEPAVLEKKIKISKEISIILASNQHGIAVYPATEMVFDTVLNQLDKQLSPADLTEKVLWKIEAIAIKVVRNLRSDGLFAVEMFIDAEQNVWVNETAPRVHNSGHHTIEANYSSQFDMMWRIMLNYPLGNPKHIVNAALINIVGEKDADGIPVYEGLEEVLKMENVFVHIYGKKKVRPGRKMGHVTVLSNERQELIHVSNKIKQILKVRSA